MGLLLLAGPAMPAHLAIKCISVMLETTSLRGHLLASASLTCVADTLLVLAREGPALAEKSLQHGWPLTPQLFRCKTLPWLGVLYCNSSFLIASVFVLLGWLLGNTLHPPAHVLVQKCIVLQSHAKGILRLSVCTEAMAVGDDQALPEARASIHAILAYTRLALHMSLAASSAGLDTGSSHIQADGPGMPISQIEVVSAIMDGYAHWSCACNLAHKCVSMATSGADISWNLDGRQKEVLLPNGQCQDRGRPAPGHPAGW